MTLILGNFEHPVAFSFVVVMSMVVIYHYLQKIYLSYQKYQMEKSLIKICKMYLELEEKKK